MECYSFLRSPKREEQQVPDDSAVTGNGEIDTMDELESILGIENDQGNLGWNKIQGHLSWDFMDWEETEQEAYSTSSNKPKVVKKENLGFWELDDEKKVSNLTLNLNYQHVLDAWSDRGPLWADDAYYMGEVPVMEEERARREASVLRYKEKRQTRLFSKKIRYQVRKLNADKRPRLKGRFVKTL